MSIIVILVALTRAAFSTTIVKVTKVLLPTTVKSAVLLTTKITGTTSTVTLEITSVLFSSEVTLTTFVQLPVALVLATIV